MQGLKCEHKNCNSLEGRDYKRKETVEGWEEEPIFLCKEHSIGYELCDNQIINVTGNIDTGCIIQTYVDKSEL